MGANHVVEHAEGAIALYGFGLWALLQSKYETPISLHIELGRSGTFRGDVFVAFNQLVHHQ